MDRIWHHAEDLEVLQDLRGFVGGEWRALREIAAAVTTQQ